jgi:hypothetical protein
MALHLVSIPWHVPVRADLAVLHVWILPESGAHVLKVALGKPATGVA